MKFPHCVVDFVRPNHWKRIEIILFFFFFLKEDCQSWQHWLRIIKFVVELEIIDWMPGNYPYIIYLNFFELCKQFDISRLPLVFKQCIGKWECNSKSSGMYRVHLANFIWYVFKKIQLRSKWRKKKTSNPYLYACHRCATQHNLKQHSSYCLCKKATNDHFLHPHLQLKEDFIHCF